MPWLKTDDAEADAPWVYEIGNEAYGLYTRLKLYCAKHLTDGKVPAGVVTGYTAGAKKPLLALEVVGRVTRNEIGDVTLPFFLDDNPSRASWEAEQEGRRDRAKRAASKRWGTA